MSQTALIGCLGMLAEARFNELKATAKVPTFAQDAVGNMTPTGNWEVPKVFFATYLGMCEDTALWCQHIVQIADNINAQESDKQFRKRAVQSQVDAEIADTPSALSSSTI